MKKFICAAAIAAVGICSTVSFGGCKTGKACVEYKLSEGGDYYIVSGVSGDKLGLTSYEVPASYSAEEGGELLPVKEIGEMAFFKCTSLKNVTIPDSVTVISKNAFSYCGLLELTIPSSVTEIGYGAFGACDALTEVIIPESVTTLSSRAFAYCTGLKKVYVKAEITDLTERVFYNSVVTQSGSIYTHTSLEKVYLPATLQKIHKEALAGNMFTDIYFAGTEEQWNSVYFYETVKKEGVENEYEEKRIDSILSSGVKMHYDAEF